MFTMRTKVLSAAAVLALALGAVPLDAGETATAAPRAQLTEAIPEDWAAPDEEKLIDSSEFSNTFDLGDGFRATEISSTPVNYETGSGEWEQIPTSIEPLSDGSWGVPDNPLEPTFAAASDADAVASFSSDGYSLSFTLLGGESSTLEDETSSGEQTAANEAVYKDVFDGVDLAYEVSASAVKETLVLQEAPAAGESSWSWDVSAPGLTLVKDEFGDLKFKNPNGKTVFRIPAPVMWDSSGEADVREPAEHPVATSYSSIPNGWRLTLNAAADWLNAADRQYPVYVDPTTTLGDSTLTAYKSDGATRTDYVHIGNSRDSNTNKIWRTQVKYPYSSLFGKQVLDATINASYQSGSTAAFTGSINTASCTGYSCVGTNLGAFSVASVGSASPNALASQIATWVNSGVANKMIVIRGSEASTYTYKALNTTLSVLWRELPRVVAFTGPSPAQGATTTTRPTLNVAVANPGGGTASVRYTISTASPVWDDFTHRSPWGAPGPYTVPAGALTPGVQYYWSAEIMDSYNGVLGTSTLRRFSSTATFSAVATPLTAPTAVTLTTHEEFDTTGLSEGATPLASALVSGSDVGPVDVDFELYLESDTEFTNTLASCSTVLTDSGTAQCELLPAVLPNTDYVLRARASDAETSSSWAQSAVSYIDLVPGDGDPAEIDPELPVTADPEPVESIYDLFELSSEESDGQEAVEDPVASADILPTPETPTVPTTPGGTSPMVPAPDDPTCDSYEEVQEDGELAIVDYCATETVVPLTEAELAEAIESMEADGGPMSPVVLDDGDIPPAARGAAAASTIGKVVAPSWCLDALGKVLTTRFESCTYNSWNLTITETVRGVKRVRGTANGILMHHMFVSGSQNVVGSKFSFLIKGTTGNTAGVTFSASGSCTSCTTKASNFPTIALSVRKWVDGEYYPASTATTSGAVKYPKVTWKTKMAVPGGVEIVPLLPPSLSTRCDKAYAGAAGCAMSGYTPAAVFTAASWPEFTAHVKAAQASGLPGNSRSNPLTRKWGEAAATASRDIACPRSKSLPRPAGKTCDEYPFASSYQGAVAGSKARTFSFCGISPVVSKTGASGFSRCMINEAQNNAAGVWLKAEYKRLRLLDNEKFWVAFK